MRTRWSSPAKKPVSAILRPLLGIAAVAVCALLAMSTSKAQAPAVMQVTATTDAQVRRWDDYVERRQRSGELRVARTTADTVMPSHTYERLDQYYKGVPVFGGDMTREFDAGVPAYLMGRLYTDIDLDVVPRLSPSDARIMLERFLGQPFREAEVPRLVVLPKDDGGYVLTYELEAFANRDVGRYFVDANNGEVVLQYSAIDRQSPSIGQGTGVLNDLKKVSASLLNGMYYADDLLRPARIITYDLKGNYDRADYIVFYGWTPTLTDTAADSDNEWTDGAVVDAHVNAGRAYDYYYKRMGRYGIDNQNRTLKLIVHPVPRGDWRLLFYDYSDYYVNAFRYRDYLVFGEGLPSTVTYGGVKYNYFSAAVDIVAHELSHAVIGYSSGLLNRNESGALNEAFADIMATSIEFFSQPRAADVSRGNEPLKADYVMGEDVSSQPLRSMASPSSYSQLYGPDPDHYSLRYRGLEDQGGVHVNSTIASHAFYLAVEGGTNRTSGRLVRGVGPDNREQIEKTFFRAFVYKLGSNATFSLARAATIQAARELYGRGSAAEQAIIQAWDAVGVDVGVNPAFSEADRGAVGKAIRRQR